MIRYDIIYLLSIYSVNTTFTDLICFVAIWKVCPCSIYTLEKTSAIPLFLENPKSITLEKVI